MTKKETHVGGRLDVGMFGTVFETSRDGEGNRWWGWQVISLDVESVLVGRVLYVVLVTLVVEVRVLTLHNCHVGLAHASDLPLFLHSYPIIRVPNVREATIRVDFGLLLNDSC